MKLYFKKIHRETIFNADFDNLNKDNGVLKFKNNHSSGGMVVVYAPNGTGKSSFTKVLEVKESSKELDFLAEDDKGKTIIPSDNMFHVISDQISRNIISGDESDYLIGADIKREHELNNKVNEGFEYAFGKNLPHIFKDKYKISKKSDVLLENIKENYPKFYSYITNIINTRKRGVEINRDEFISFVQDSKYHTAPKNLDEEKQHFFIDDSKESNIIGKLLKIDINSILPNNEVNLLEQYSDAISILQKYHQLDKCIVCDNKDFDGDSLLENKRKEESRIQKQLDSNTEKLLNSVVENPSLKSNDPFHIKEIIINFISGNNDEKDLIQLIDECNSYRENVNKAILFDLVSCFDDTTMVQDYNDLISLRENQPELDDEDLIYIQNVISENIDRDIKIERQRNNFKLMLGNEHLLNVDRKNMHLSTGEQNFISLAFELLLARNSNKEYVVIDDPMSSFDSIYKNKIAYCIVKFLENKKQIVLTHNLELLRLLDLQLPKCFNLYLLNNYEKARNGFIPVNNNEKQLLVDLAKLIEFLQNKNKLLENIKEKRLFLISMIPFMRGYAHIMLDTGNIYKQLSKVMHGYETETLDLVPVYNELFGEVFQGSEKVSVEDIIQIDLNQLDFFSKDNYPLFAETLKQTLIYLYLRMNVEKRLMTLFKISRKSTENLLLGQIIQKAFIANEGDSDYKEKIKFKVFFTSRKTLLNDFNHFEGNINIFQPAIDIAPSFLDKEVADILNALDEVENKYGNKEN
ncbi:AAA family ATPase [Absicoccus porci]|uniref:AAA family ATPase n=1 Tax=Absicoccus porci TaxID=2486576 RepID=UPI002943F2FA|nr:hypothetical protein [Absicoccus porci]